MGSLIDSKEAIASRDKILNGAKFMETEEVKRPDHPDFLDSFELKKLEWSGIRANKIVGRMEVWVLGTMLKDFSPSQKADMLLFMEETFGFETSQLQLGD